MTNLASKLTLSTLADMKKTAWKKCRFHVGCRAPSAEVRVLKLKLAPHLSQKLVLGGNLSQKLVLGGNLNQKLAIGGNLSQKLAIGGNLNQKLAIGGNLPQTCM
jgi:hypothetical protein